MKYEWEDTVPSKMGFIAGYEEDEFIVAAFAVINKNTGEAALIYADDVFGHDVTSADVALDILGDATEHYSKIKEKAFEQGFISNRKVPP